MSNKENVLDTPAFAVIFTSGGLAYDEVELFYNIKAMKRYIEDLKLEMFKDDAIAVCEIKDIIVYEEEDEDEVTYISYPCPNDGFILQWDPDEECYVCDKCGQYWYDFELDAIYVY